MIRKGRRVTYRLKFGDLCGHFRILVYTREGRAVIFMVQKDLGFGVSWLI
jgi:hypothetical protein